MAKGVKFPLKLVRNPNRGDYTPLNLISVSNETLVSNYSYLKELNPKIKIAPVLKSNAYGHGLVNVGKALEKLKPAMFCVDSLYEAYELYKAKIKTPILIMGFVNPDNLKVKKLPFAYAVYDFNQLQLIYKHQPEAAFHIKVDTGMNRLGIKIEHLPIFLKQIKKLKKVKIEGLMSHLASAGIPQSEQTERQMAIFHEALKLVENESINLKWKHLAASDGLLIVSKEKLSKLTNLARVGLALYGVHSADGHKLVPVLELTSSIVQIKKIGVGEKVGYDATFTARKNMTTAQLPLGYNDGLDRRLSNNGIVKINNVVCPIIGRVSMNITTVDISKVKNPKILDKVLVYSCVAKDKNSIINVSKTCVTIPYEILVHLSPISLSRVLV